MSTQLPDLPAEVLDIIVGFVARSHQSILALRRTCSVFYQVASRYHYEVLVLQSGPSGPRHLDSLFIDKYRNTSRVKSIRVVPSPSTEGRVQSLGSRRCTDVTRINGLTFNNLEAIRIMSPGLLDAKQLSKYLGRWRHIKQLTLSLSLRLSQNRDFRRNIRRLDSLSCLEFEIHWPMSQDYYKMDVSPMWDAVKNNAATLRCIRVNLVHWDTPRRNEFLPDGTSKVSPRNTAFMNGMLNFVDIGSSTTRPIRLRVLFPIDYDQWPENFNALQILQLGWTLLSTENPFSTEGRLFRTENLEILSLIECHHASSLLEDLSWQFSSLRCLQAVSSVRSHAMERILARLKPLSALYLSPIAADYRPLLSGSLANHRNSLRVLWVENLGSGLAGSIAFLDFTHFSNLEELAVSTKITLHLYYLRPPSSLKCLRFIAQGTPCGKLPGNIFYRWIKTYAIGQLGPSKVGIPKLQVLYIDAGFSIANISAPIILATEYDTSLPNETGDVILDTNSINEAEMREKYSHFSILGSEADPNMAWRWIEKFM
ncbi:hypothetical protein H072_1370 [Dactylellina haptotyla CBS 200.50]|uniref:F-box domain-containing protein n=1 Tax=Dactylellina haptotyla (strain CBS 200.50) TaxID=1284197 RepID=S8BYM7_DACHA|nr:hypothetical protein H072_1370 [Dactylellina haptotyla CBS 200.50]